FKPTKRVMAPSGRYTPARSPQRLVVEADGSFDVRDTDQNSGHASAHGSSPSFITGSTLAIVSGRDRSCNPLPRRWLTVGAPHQRCSPRAECGGKELCGPHTPLTPP